MKRVFRNPGPKAALTVEEVAERMLEQGATGRECRGMARALELFVEWSAGMGRAADREGGIAWLRGRQAGMTEEAFAEMKAGLTTWFHLTGQAKVGLEGAGNEAEGGAGAVSQGARVMKVAGTWKEAGERFKGYLACKNYSRNTVECYVGWARRVDSGSPPAAFTPVGAA